MFVYIPPHHALSGVSHPRESFKCLFSEEKAGRKADRMGCRFSTSPQASGKNHTKAVRLHHKRMQPHCLRK